jgi:hypothetical protein
MVKTVNTSRSVVVAVKNYSVVISFVSSLLIIYLAMAITTMPVPVQGNIQAILANVALLLSGITLSIMCQKSANEIWLACGLMMLLSTIIGSFFLIVLCANIALMFAIWVSFMIFTQKL